MKNEVRPNTRRANLIPLVHNTRAVTTKGKVEGKLGLKYSVKARRGFQKGKGDEKEERPRWGKKRRINLQLTDNNNNNMKDRDFVGRNRRRDSPG